MLPPEMRAILCFLALPLLVTRVRADHENPAVTADDLALLAHGLDRGSDFHARFALLVRYSQCSHGPALATGTVAATVLRSAEQREISRCERTRGCSQGLHRT